MKNTPERCDLAAKILELHLIKPKKGRELTTMEHYQNEKTLQIAEYVDYMTPKAD